MYVYITADLKKKFEGQFCVERIIDDIWSWLLTGCCYVSNNPLILHSLLTRRSINTQREFFTFTAGVARVSQMISQPVSSIFLRSPLPSGPWRNPGLSIPWCCLPTFFFFFLSVLSSFPFHCALQDGFGQTWWMGGMSISLQRELTALNRQGTQQQRSDVIHSVPNQP